MTLWEIDIHPKHHAANRPAMRIAADAADLGVIDDLQIHAARGFLLEGDLTAQQVDRVARELLVDGVVEQAVCAPVGDHVLLEAPALSGNGAGADLVHVLPQAGVTDPVAESTQRAIADLDIHVRAVRTLKKYWLGQLEPAQLERLCRKVLANDSIEQVVIGPLTVQHLEIGAPYQFQLMSTPLRQLDDDQLAKLSRDGQLYLTLAEMQQIQRHFRELGREPTDIELETIAQTWSEHCSHKTLAGIIEYEGDHGPRRFENMLKETIFAATQTIRQRLGAEDWCVSVFEDNAGIVQFDDEFNVVFKVETHNHPSALEPYGGANTGIGGVIRDPLGTGLGAKPVANTDVFCFAPPDVDPDSLPPGVLHPRRVMKGVVAGVRDYGNRMGIPTVNGAIYFDQRYLGNPLVYCGNIGILPVDKSSKQPQPGDLIVAMGGRTGRDGIHGATFSSAELTSDSETISGGAVQIGNAITEKMLLDVLLTARDQGLYHAVTDCGAGGFSSAIGEMGAEIGAEVWLERAPLKYEGLSYTEIWISEAQERMILAVPPENWEAFHDLCAAENVEATVLGKFVPTGRLGLSYDGQQVCDLAMSLLHDGRPRVVRQAVYRSASPTDTPAGLAGRADWTDTLQRILGSWNVCSKEWVIRQYDHEVQGGSVIKPLVGCDNDGPSDAAVIRPRLDAHRGLAISCGMNPHYGDLDPYHMAASAIDEAVRNCVAVGADPSRIAILDNFCWGYTDRPETLGTLVRAALACHDLAIAWGTPFISGKDSLNNEFSYVDHAQRKHTISIPPTLLISALGQIADTRKCVSMDLKQAGNLIYMVGQTQDELGGSHLLLTEQLAGGRVPQVDARSARTTFTALHAAIERGLVRACHDLSEGGLAVSAAEMALAGGLGLQIRLADVPHNLAAHALSDAVILFSESNSRFLCEVPAADAPSFETSMAAVPHAAVGQVTESGSLHVVGVDTTSTVVNASIEELKQHWQAPLRWN